jgi:ABC-type antimicrobial peptide transport system permease subunit
MKRAFHHRAILLPVLLGVLAAVTILCSVPLFSAAAAEVGLEATLHSPGGAIDKNVQVDFTTPALDPATYSQATKAVTANIQYYLGSNTAPNAPLLQGELPSQALYQAGDAHHFPSGLIHTANIWFMDGMDAQHLTLTQGRFPASTVQAVQTSQGTAYDIEALISKEWANQYNLHLNDILEVADEIDHPGSFLRLHFVGFFQPKNLKDPIWFDSGDPFTLPIAAGNEPLPPSPIWISQQAFENAVPNLGLTRAVDYTWFYYLNLNAIAATNAASVKSNLQALKAQFQLARGGNQQANYDAKSGLDQLLDTFLQKLFFVTVATLVAILPGLALLLLYVGLAASALAERNREEIALMKSRGASTWQVLALSAIEAILLCGVSLLVAPLLAGQVTGVLTQFSFFGGAAGNSASLLSTPTSQTYLYASAAAALCLLTLLLPSLAASRASLVVIKREGSRPKLLSLIVRLAPGVFLAALGVFGYIEIRQRGAFFSQDTQGTLSVDWVAASAPTLLLLGAAGIGLLLLPPLLALLDRLGQRIPGISVGLALRQMARRPTPYSRLVLLLTLTIALGIFASLFSGTLVTSFGDRAAYLSGADLRLVEGQEGQPDAERIAAPLADQMQVLPGVTDGMNVFRDKGEAPSEALRFADVYTLGIDSTKYQRLGYWRSDFADQPLPALLQSLRSKVSQAGVIPAVLDDQLLADSGKHIGDQINIQLGTTVDANFLIVGTFHYFPTLDTGQYALVCDINLLVQAVNQSNALSQIAPNEVWLKLAPNAPHYTTDLVENDLINNPQHKQVIIDVQQTYDRAALTDSLRNDPLHFSISGALSLDFVVAALLSVIGFVVLFYVIAQRRAFEFGVLRAMGLSLRQLASSLSWEQITLLLSAIILGLALGIVLAQSVLPALATDETGKALLPPFATHLDVQSVVQLGLFLIACTLAASAATLVIFRRLQLHEVLRLGEE